MKMILAGILIILLVSACSGKKGNLIIAENKLPGTTDWHIEVRFDSCVYPEHQYGRRPLIERFEGYRGAV